MKCVVLLDKGRARFVIPEIYLFLTVWHMKQNVLGLCACVCVCVCARERVRERMFVCARVCVHAHIPLKVFFCT